MTGVIIGLLCGLLGGLAAGAIMSRKENERLARIAWEAQMDTRRVEALLYYTTHRGMRCPAGADYRAWLSLVETAMVKAEAERLVGEQQD